MAQGGGPDVNQIDLALKVGNAKGYLRRCMADNVVILEPVNERAQKISKAMASQTASDILQSLADNKKSLTEMTYLSAIFR